MTNYLDVGREGLMLPLSTVLERHQDHVWRDRSATEHFISDGRRDGIHQ